MLQLPESRRASAALTICATTESTCSGAKFTLPFVTFRMSPTVTYCGSSVNRVAMWTFPCCAMVFCHLLIDGIPHRACAPMFIKQEPFPRDLHCLFDGEVCPRFSICGDTHYDTVRCTKTVQSPRIKEFGDFAPQHTDQVDQHQSTGRLLNADYRFLGIKALQV